MKRMLAMMLLMSLLSVSCNSGGGGGPSTEDSSQSLTDSGSNDTAATDVTPSNPSTAPTSSSVPNLALSFSTNVDYMNLTMTQEEKYDEAVSLVKKVVGTTAFRTKVLNHTYNGTKSFANNNGLTNSQIYQTILDAAEKLKPIKNNTLDVGVKMYYQNNSVVGWTNTSITYINVNTKFFNSYDPHEVAGNLFHEWLHKLGYGHDSTATTRRPYSVPYAIGYMIRDLGKNFL